MKTRTKTIEVQEEVWELTRDQLMTLRNAMRGGNATNDTAQVLTHGANLLRGHDDFSRAMRERALFLTSGVAMIDSLLWPSDDTGTADSPS